MGPWGDIEKLRREEYSFLTRDATQSAVMSSVILVINFQLQLSYSFDFLVIVGLIVLVNY